MIPCRKLLSLSFVLVSALTLASPAGAQMHAYDALGRLTRVVYEDGTTLTYTYDTRGNLLELQTSQQSPPVTYCTAKVNSCGTTPAISWLGFPSASASAGFFVRSSVAKATKKGLLLYTNSGRAAFPFQGGFLCVNPAPLKRGPGIQAGGTPGSCDGDYSLDVNAFAQGQAGGTPDPFLLVPGTVVNCQWIARDSVQHGSYLSDGLEYVVAP